MKFSESQLKSIDLQKNQQLKEWIAKGVEERCSLNVSYYVSFYPKKSENHSPLEESSQHQPHPKCFKMQVRFYFSVISPKQPDGRVWNRDAMLPLFHSLFFDKESLQKHISRSVYLSQNFKDIRDSEEFKHFLRFQSFKLLKPFFEEDTLLIIKRSFLLAFMNRLIEENDPLIEHYQVILSGPLLRGEAIIKTVRKIEDFIKELRNIFYNRIRQEPNKIKEDCGDVIVQELKKDLEKVFTFLRDIKMNIFEHFELGQFENIIEAMIIGMWNSLFQLGLSQKEPVFVSQIRQKVLKRVRQFHKIDTNPNSPQHQNLIFLEIDSDLTKSFFEIPKTVNTSPLLKLSTLQTVSSLCKGLFKFLFLHTSVNFPFLLPESNPIRLFTLHSLESNGCQIFGKGKLSQKFNFHKYYEYSETIEIDSIAKNLRAKSKKLKKTGPMITSLILCSIFKKCGIQKFIEDMILDLGLGGKTSSIFHNGFVIKRNELVQSIIQSELLKPARLLPSLFSSRHLMETVFKSDNNHSSMLQFQTKGSTPLSKSDLESHTDTPIYSFNHFEKLSSISSSIVFLDFLKKLNWRGVIGNKYPNVHVRDLASLSLDCVSFAKDSKLLLNHNPDYFIDFYFPDGKIPEALDFLSDLISRLILKLHPRFVRPSDSLCIYEITPLSPNCSEYISELNKIISNSDPDNLLLPTKSVEDSQEEPPSPSDDNPLFQSLLYHKVSQLIKDLISNNESITLQLVSLDDDSCCQLQICALIEGALGQTIYLNNYLKFLPSSSLLFRGFLDSKDRDLFFSILQLFPLNPKEFLSKKVNSLFLQFDIGNLLKWKFYRQESHGRSYISKRISNCGQGISETIFKLRQSIWTFRGFVKSVLIQQLRTDLKSHFPEKEYNITQITNTYTSNQIDQGNFGKRI
jgi:hypothetical protein